MKFSEALEHCLTTGQYRIYEYMCIALEENGLVEHVPAVMEVVHNICEYSASLFGALAHARPEAYTRAFKDKIGYGFQFYCWLVFDLKRKGL